QGSLDLTGIPFIIHAELPLEKETFIGRIVKHESSDDEVLAITLSTDLELPMVRKIEQSIGQRIPVSELPENLIVENENPENDKAKAPKITKNKNIIPDKGDAFHEKKASNAKDYNYS